MTTENTTTKKKLQGTVVSTAMTDTVTVLVESYEKHPKYGKFIRRRKKYMAHDAGNTKKVGEKVTIEECAPRSKNKHFVVVGS